MKQTRQKYMVCTLSRNADGAALSKNHIPAGDLYGRSWRTCVYVCVFLLCVVITENESKQLNRMRNITYVKAVILSKI